MELTIIAAVGRNGVLGNKNKLPWRLPRDLKHFKETTMGKPVIMGRKTFESLGRPLPGRLNIVLSKTESIIKGALVLNSPIAAMLYLTHETDEAFVIGGADIYQTLMDASMKMVITEVHASPDGDAFFPTIKEDDWNITRGSPYLDNNILCNIATYERRIGSTIECYE